MSNILKLLTSIVICELAGIIGSFFINASNLEWYGSLNIPSFPPESLFGPVWIVLYLLMGVSLFIVWKEDLKNKQVKIAFMIFIVMLIINILWSIIFFGLRSVAGGLAVDIFLVFMILITILKFKKISTMAAMLLIPTLLWVSFASIWNFYIYKLN